MATSILIMNQAQTHQQRNTLQKSSFAEKGKYVNLGRFKQTVNQYWTLVVWPRYWDESCITSCDREGKHRQSRNTMFNEVSTAPFQIQYTLDLALQNWLEKVIPIEILIEIRN